MLKFTAHDASNWHHQTIEHLTPLLKATYPFRLCNHRIQCSRQRPIVDIVGPEHGIRGITEHREHTHTHSAQPCPSLYLVGWKLGMWQEFLRGSTNPQVYQQLYVVVRSRGIWNWELVSCLRPVYFCSL